MDKEVQQELEIHDHLFTNLKQHRECQAMFNRRGFSYPRAHHYFFDLHRFPRVKQHPDFQAGQAPGSCSYALDDSNAFQHNYLYDNVEIKGMKRGSILNRKMFGCPLNDYLRRQTKDKNPNHVHLFRCQDRSYSIDRALYSCRRLLQNFQELFLSGKLYNFEVIKKNEELSPILQGKATKEQCKDLLQRQIKRYQQQKKNMNMINRRDLSFFYDASVNQKLYNQIQNYVDILQVSYSFNDLIDRSVSRLNLIPNKQDRFMPEHIKQLFYYFLTSKPCISPESLNRFCRSANSKFIQKLQNKNFSIDFPLNFYSFANQGLLENTERLIGAYLNRQNEGHFYILKSLWLRLTGRQIPKIKINCDNYLEQLETIGAQLKQYVQQNPNQAEESEVYPFLDELVTLGQLEGSVADYIFPRTNQQEITPRQFYIFTCIVYLYNSLSTIGIFLNQNLRMIRLMAFPFFSKYQHYILNIVNKRQLGIICEILDAISNSLNCDTINAEWRLGLTFDRERKIGYIHALEDEQQWQEESSSSNNSQINDEKQYEGQSQDKVMKKRKLQ